MVRFAVNSSSQCSVAASSTSYNTSSSATASGPSIHDDYIDYCDVDVDDDDRDDDHHKVNHVNRISQPLHPTTYPNSSSIRHSDNPEDLALINALMELQHELRIKHEEVSVLQQTLSNLSRIVQESDRHVEHLEMVNERLQFKLQMLTFLEPNEDRAGDLDSDHHGRSPRRDHYRPWFQNSVSNSSSSSVRSSCSSSSSHASRHSLFPQQHPWDTYSTGSEDFVLGPLGTMGTVGTTEMNHWTTEDPIPVEPPPPPPRPQLRRSASMSSLQSPQQQLPVSFPLFVSPSASAVVSKLPPRPETWNANRRTRTSTPVSVDDLVYEEDDDDEEDSTTKSTTLKASSRSQNQNKSSHDLFQEEKKDDDLYELKTEDVSNSETNTTKSTRSNVLVGPSQAHFYQIIQERDAYKTKYQRMMNDYHSTQKKLYSTQYKLRSCNALLELSYHNHSTGGTSSSSQKMNRKVSKSHAPSRGGPPKATAAPRRHSRPQSPAAPASPLTPHGNDHATATRNHPPPPPLPTERAKIPTTWRRNYGIAPTIKEQESSSFLSECVSYISHDEMIHPHWNASSDQAVEAMATDQYIDALVACEPTTTTTTRGSKKESSTAIDAADNRLYRHHNHKQDDADRGAGRPTVAQSPSTARVVESIMFDV